jgi:hypothetical protein
MTAFIIADVLSQNEKYAIVEPITEADGVKDLGFLLYPENIWG